jgi:NAD+ synthase (glutamine-hydrolysing)
MQIIVASAVLNQTPLDWDGNKARILAAIAQAQGVGARVLCLPELAISGNGCEDALLAPSTLRMARQLLREILPATAGIITTLGLPLAYQQQTYNAVVLAADGEIIGIAAKSCLADGDVHFEPRWFTPWPAGMVSEIELDGLRYPFGDLLFNCGGLSLRVDIFDGARQSPARHTDVDLLLNAGTSYFAFGAFDRRLAAALARSAGGVYLAANLIGN